MQDTVTLAVATSVVGALVATVVTVASLYSLGYLTPLSGSSSNGQLNFRERGRHGSVRNGNGVDGDHAADRRPKAHARGKKLPVPKYYEDGTPDQEGGHLQGRAPTQHCTPAKALPVNQPPAAPSPISTHPGPSPGPADHCFITPNASSMSPTRRMMPIATPSPGNVNSPRAAAANTVVTSSSRPGSPMAGQPQTGMHVTSRVQEDASKPIMPPPPHMMLESRTQAPVAPRRTALMQPASANGLTTVRNDAGARSRGEMIEAEAVSDSFHRVIASESTMTEEEESVCHQLVQALDMRWKWLFRPQKQPQDDTGDPEVAVPSEVRDPFAYTPLPKSHLTFRLVDGVFRVFEAAPVETPRAEGSVGTMSNASIAEGPTAVTPAATDRRSPSPPRTGSPVKRSPGSRQLKTPRTNANGEVEVFPLPGNDREFFTDMLHLSRLGAAGPVLSYCHHRLTLLEQKFNLHCMLNADKERLATKTAPHRDFYNVRKIDTHVHHSACMHQKHLLRFIKHKLKKEQDEIVIFRDGKYMTLQEVFESLNMTAYDLNVDKLDMHADKTIFHRFDRFNLKYNPFGQSRLREVFIKQDNLLHGRFLAELTKEVFADLEDTKYQHTEYRISIYGRKTIEWDVLAAWVCQNKLYSDKNVWLIQVPRLYNIYKAQGLLANFEEMIHNIFQPLFEVTADPTSHPQLHIFLQQVVGFDCVDDESKPERRPTKNMPKPVEWNNKYNAAYSYYIYYLYANLFVLNSFRQSRGLNTFSFRPHCGEAGELDHLASAFMVCDNIAHGINLRKSPMLQYLYYLAQIGLCMSPLSNNSLFLDYHKNPFPTYFARGLSVSLSTDDPLQIHLTKEPLVEEYSVAANMWKLTTTDLCEIARNSVLHSGFPHECKKHWLSSTYWKNGTLGNDIQKTNVPNLRMRFRFETHQEEIRLLYIGSLEHARQGNANLRLD